MIKLSTGSKSFARLTAVASVVAALAACGDSNVFKLAELEAAADAARAEVVDNQTAAVLAQSRNVVVAAAYASGCTVTDGTLFATGTGVDGRYLFLADPGPVVTATGCVNPVTQSELPPLSQRTSATGDIVVTPISSLVAAAIAALPEGADAQAVSAKRAEIAGFLGIDADDLDADPVAVFATKPDVLRVSVALTSLIETVAAVAELSPEAASTAVINAVVANPNAANAGSIAAVVTAGDQVKTDKIVAVQEKTAALLTTLTSAKEIEAVIEVAATVSMAVKDDPDVSNVGNAFDSESQNLPAIVASISDSAVTAPTPAAVTAAATSIVKSEVTKVVSGGTSSVLPPSAVSSIKAEVAEKVDPIVQDIIDNGGTGSVSTGSATGGN
jgi:hypothetical protein